MRESPPFDSSEFITRNTVSNSPPLPFFIPFSRRVAGALSCREGGREEEVEQKERRRLKEEGKEGPRPSSINVNRLIFAR